MRRLALALSIVAGMTAAAHADPAQLTARCDALAASHPDDLVIERECERIRKLVWELDQEPACAEPDLDQDCASDSQRGHELARAAANALTVAEDAAACDTGDAGACFRIREDRRGRALLDRACKKRRDATACETLALAYEHGTLGVTPSTKKAKKLFKLAVRAYERRCDREDADACRALSDAYRHGRLGVKKSRRKATVYAGRAYEYGPGRGEFLPPR